MDKLKVMHFVNITTTWLFVILRIIAFTTPTAHNFKDGGSQGFLVFTDRICYGYELFRLRRYINPGPIEQDIHCFIGFNSTLNHTTIEIRTCKPSEIPEYCYRTRPEVVRKPEYYYSCDTKAVFCLVENSTNSNWLVGNSTPSRSAIESIGNAVNFPEAVKTILINHVSLNINGDIEVLRTFTSVEKLSLNNAQLREIPANLLLNSNEMLSLSFGHNKIVKVTSESFINSKYLRNLDLSYNLVETLGVCARNKSDNFLVRMESLRKLDLGHNRISKICPNFFHYTPHLNTLNLNNNNILTLDGVFTSDRNNIRYLDIAYNYLEYISDRDFLYLTKLRNMNLANNYLEYISDRDFLYLTNLNELDLSSNHIKVIDKLAFHSLSRLEKLNLDNNFLNSSDYLYNLTIKYEISLENNFLQTIPREVRRVYEMKLGWNHISHVTTSGLLIADELPVVTLLMQNNDIRTVDASNVYLTNNTDIKLNLDNNPLTCDCNIKNLHRAVTHRETESFNVAIEKSSNVYCFQPESLRNISFTDVDENLLQCTESIQCPQNCTCEFLNPDIDVIVNCDRNNFADIPVDVPTNATHLSVNFNPLTGLKNLHVWISLRTLILEHCSKLHLAESDVTELKRLKNLKELSLENNGLTSLPRSIFDGVNNLAILKLSHNLLTRLPDNVISSLGSLTHISINNNRLELLNDDIFENNLKLQNVEACCNDLTSIKMNISSLKDLVFVDFSNNKLESVEIEWPENVKEILLSDNRIKSVNLQKFPQNLHLLDLSTNQLVYLNTTNFFVFNRSSGIILNDNPVYCDCNLKQFLEYLEVAKERPKAFRFRVEKLYCNSPQSMKGMLVEDINIAKLPCEERQCAEDCKCFQQLSCEYKIMECDTFPDSDFVGNFNQLFIQRGDERNVSEFFASKWDSLNDVTIEKLTDANLTTAIFSRMTNLTTLSMIDNKNLRFSFDVFSNLLELTDLDLHSSEIRVVQSNSFRGDCKLQVLNLSHNFLSTLPKDIFLDLIKLQTLDLRYNALTSLDINVFESLSNLKSLKLNQNSLKSLEKKILYPCKSLKKLDLSANLLIDLRGFFIPNQISEVDFSNNSIANIEDSWADLRNVKAIDLSFNTISIVNVTQLIIFPAKTKINLQNNDISRVIWFSDNDNEYRSESPEVNLGSNPYNCDCKLIQFIRDINQQHSGRNLLKTDAPKKLFCFQPTELTGTSFSNVDYNDLYCNLDNCPKGCTCKHFGHGEINVVDCNVTSETDLQICPDVVDELYMRGSTSIQYLQKDCWKLLKKLSVANNTLATRITDQLLYNHVQLIELSLSGNRMRKIPSKLFQFTPKIESVDFSKNLLRNLSPKLFENLNNLVKIDLSGNRLKLIDWQLPLSLQSLNLAENRIEGVVIPKLNDHYRLKTLNLTRNGLKEVPNKPDYLFLLKNLEILDLSHNNVVIDCDVQFSPFSKSLRSLNLSHNLLDCAHFWSEFSKPTSRLRNFDLSYNPIKSLKINDFVFGNNSQLILNMANCNITSYFLSVSHEKNEVWKVLTSIDVSGNEQIECDCNIRRYRNSGKIQNDSLTLNLQLFTKNQCYINYLGVNFDLLSKYDRVSNDIVCSITDDCPSNCSCLKSNFVTRVFCVEKGFTSLPSMCPIDVRYLNLDYNNLTVVKGLDHPKWQNLTTISLRHNRITSLSNENLTNLQFLRYVFLDGNRLQSPSGWLEYFVNENILSFNVTLSNNPWSCNCENELFKTWASDTQIKPMILDIDDIFCDDGKLLITVNLCPTQIWKTLLPVLAASFVIVTMLTLTVIYYRKKMLVHAWCYGNNLCGCCVKEDEIDAEKIYDAFLSYCEEDGEYVARKLLPGLEESPPFYKICIHHRDWRLGVPIIEQIETSVKNSRRVIIVLSRNFTQSPWLNVEFRIANMQSMEDKVNRLIIITLDQDFLTDDLDPELKAYLTVNNYLKSDDSQFWNKLRYSMPRKKNKKIRRRRTSTLELVEYAEDTV